MALWLFICFPYAGSMARLWITHVIGFDTKNKCV